MQAIALAAGKILDELLLVRALEVEARDIGAAVNLLFAEIDHLVAFGDFLPHILARVQRVAVLIDIAELHRRADAEAAVIGLLAPRDHLEQRCLTGAVRPDDADNRPRGQLEGHILNQQPVAIALADIFRLDHQIAKPRPGRDIDLHIGGLLLGLLRQQILIGADPGLGFGLAALCTLADPFQFAVQRPAPRIFRLAFLGKPLFLLFQPA